MIKFLREIAGALIVAFAILFTWAYQNACWAQNANVSVDQMQASLPLYINEAQKNLARKYLQCPNVVVEFKPASEMQAKTVDGRYVEYAGLFRNPAIHGGMYVVWINERVYRLYTSKLKLHVIQHELVHCGRYDFNKRLGRAQPPALDAQEEMWTESITLELLDDLDADPK